MSWRSAGSAWSSSGRRSSRIRSAAGKPVREAVISGSRSRNSALRSGASADRSFSVGLSSRAAGRSWVTSGSVSLANALRRLSVVGRLALEGRQRDEGLLQLAVARRGGREDVVGVLDQPAQLVAALGQRAEHDAGVRDQAPHRPLLAVEDVDRLARVLGERAEVAERVVEVAPAALDRLGLRLHPDLEGAPRLRVEGAEDLVELDGRGDLRRRSGCPPSGTAVACGVPGVSST